MLENSSPLGVLMMWSLKLVSFTLIYSDPGPAPEGSATIKVTPNVPLFHSTTSCPCVMSAGLIQASTVNPSASPTLRLAEAGTRTSALVPLNLNAWPTSPAANATPPSKTPLLVPAKSLATPSPRHQLTKPCGAGAHVGEELTISAALELVTEPARLVTTTR